jgi:hypothetical protein
MLALQARALGSGVDVMMGTITVYCRSIRSFQQVVDEKHATVEVMECGYGALRNYCAALGMAGDIFDKALYDAVHQEVTPPYSGLNFGQTEGFHCMHQKDTVRLEEWFVGSRDSSFGVCLSAKKHRLH